MFHSSLYSAYKPIIARWLANEGIYNTWKCTYELHVENALVLSIQFVNSLPFKKKSDKARTLLSIFSLPLEGSNIVKNFPQMSYS